MLSPDKYPIHQLVTLWRNCRTPRLHEIPGCRARLFTAATHEITAHANAGKSYDPLTDHRFRWAGQWIEVGEGTRRAIDPNIEFTLHLLLDACPSSQKLTAANDRE